VCIHTAIAVTLFIVSCAVPKVVHSIVDVSAAVVVFDEIILVEPLSHDELVVFISDLVVDLLWL
jgi:hypothetical protein